MSLTATGTQLPWHAPGAAAAAKCCCGDDRCPTPWLDFAAKAMTKSKIDCGFVEFTAPTGKFYKTITTVHVVDYNEQATNEDDEVTSNVWSGGWTETITQGRALDGSCDRDTLHTYSGKITHSVTDLEDVVYTVDSSGNWSPSDPPIGGLPSVDTVEESPTVQKYYYAHSDSYTAGGIDYVITGTSTRTNTLSVEFIQETTEDLIARTVAAIEDAPPIGTYNAYRNLSPDERSYTIRRLKWRVEHLPGNRCYLKVWLRRRFIPEDIEAEQVITSLDPFVWGPRSSCKTTEWLYSDWTSENEPSSNGTTTIEIVKWTCQEGYTPPDP